jgi:dTDP-4-amino-4,6-dideoxygalactose transaminase
VSRLPEGSMEVEAWGAKANLTDVAAAIGLGQLRHIDAFNARRRELAWRYFERWDGSLGFDLPTPDHEHQSNWHMFQPLLPRRLAAKRGAFIEALACTTRRCTCSRCSASAGTRPVTSRWLRTSERAR